MGRLGYMTSLFTWRKKKKKKMSVTAFAQGGKAAQGSCLARPIVSVLPSPPLHGRVIFLIYLLVVSYRFSAKSVWFWKTHVFLLLLVIFFSARSGESSLENQTIGIVKRTFKYLDKIIFVELSTFVLPILLSSRYDVVLTYKQNLLKNMQKKNSQ